MNLTKTQLDSAKNLECEKCHNKTFKNTFVIKTISGLLMPDGKETLIPIAVFSCDACGHINKKFTDDLGLDNKEA